MEDRRRGGRGKKLEDPEIFFKLSSLSLLVWKVGKIPHFHSFIVSLSLFFDFFTENDSSLSFMVCLPPDEDAFASKACGKIYLIQN